MKKNYKNLLIFAVILVMALTAFGCKKEEKKSVDSNNKTEGTVTKTPEDATVDENAGEVIPGWQLNADDKVTLTWYIHYSWYNKPWGNNIVSKKIIEETGVDIEFIIPAGNEAERLNSLIASDELPDLLTLGWWEPQIGQMIEDGLVYALDELAELYDPYWFEIADPGRVGWYTQKDGHIYGYPSFSFSPADYEKYDNVPSNETFLVRKDMYEAIGSPDMTTPEGFIAAMRAATEKFPRVNGQALIPIGLHEFTPDGNGSLDGILNNFLAIPYEKDGKFHDRRTDPEYVRWLKVFRELYAEGYLLDDVFIDKRAQMEEKIAQGRYFSMLYQRTDFTKEQLILYNNDPESIYIAIDGPKNSKGDDYRLRGQTINGWNVTLISKKCARPDRAIQIYTYFMSEHGQLMTYLGVEGEMWDYIDGVATARQEVNDLYFEDRDMYDSIYGAGEAYWMLLDPPMALKWAVPAPDPFGQMERWTYPYAISTSQYETNLEAGSDELDIQIKVNNEWGVVLPRLLLASTEEEFDQTWSNFIQRSKDWGIDKVLALRTELMNENKEKLGIK